MEKRLPLHRYDPISRLHTQAHLVQRAKFPVIDAHTHFGPLGLGEAYAERYDAKAVVERLRTYNVCHVCNLELQWAEGLQRLQSKLEGQEAYISTFASLDVTRFEDEDFPAYADATLAAYKHLGMRGVKLWKDITLYRKDRAGRHIRLDDPRLSPVFDAAGKHGLVVVIHIADPIAFFTPLDGQNEYYECLLENPEWSFAGSEFFSFAEHMRMQENILSAHPDTTFVIAHVGSCAEDLGFVGSLLERYSNLYIDIAARINELGRQPYAARAFFLRFQDRILFGTDYMACDDPACLYPYYFRFLETMDEYFDYAPPEERYSMGRWKIYGVGLPDAALKKVYHENAERVFGLACGE